MKNKIIEHISGIIFVTLLLFGFLSFYNTSRAREQERQSSSIRQFIEVPISNINDPFQRALLKDVMNVFYPDQADKNNQIINELLSTKENEFNKKLQKSHLEEHLSISKLQDLLWMLVKFLFTYIIVMLLTWYGVQTIAVWRFISKKQALERKLQLAFKKEKLSFGKKTGSIFNSIFKSIVYFILFSPAYVIAYSIRTEFNTDSLFFMIILGVISNGLLIMYSNKFYAFLISESRKGYLDTALVKNLNSSYLYNSTSGIPYSSIFKFRKTSRSCISAYFPECPFSVSINYKGTGMFPYYGLIIIEMALNIHGYLNYEMLRQMLYKNYDVVIVIILSIFTLLRLLKC